MLNFNGKTVLVTGGGEGIGRAIAEAFCRCGATVLVIEKNEATARQAQEALNQIRDDAKIFVGDVTAPDQLGRIFQDISASYAGLDVLVNNVGDYLGIVKPFDELSDDDIEALYAVNLRQLFQVTRLAIPLLRRRAPGSSIISISSIEAFRGIPACSVYGAFKAGIIGLTQSLALTYGPEGIRANVIAPETTETPQVPISKSIKPELQDSVKQWIPLGRFGRPRDMAGCALFLACEELSGWITGTTIHVDGGSLAAAGYYRDPKGNWTNTPVITGSAFDI